MNNPVYDYELVFRNNNLIIEPKNDIYKIVAQHLNNKNINFLEFKVSNQITSHNGVLRKDGKLFLLIRIISMKIQFSTYSKLESETENYLLNAKNYGCIKENDDGKIFISENRKKLTLDV